MKKGFFPALGTSFNEMGHFYEKSFERQIEHQIDAGASGLLVMGSMGNGPYIRNSEYKKVVACGARAARRACPVLVGVTDLSIGRVMDRIDELSDLDIDGVVSTIPYYSTATQDDIVSFYMGIADKSKFPVYLYDLPTVVKVPILPATIEKLWKHINIRGIKTGNLVTARTLTRSATKPDAFDIIFSNLDEFDIAYQYGINKNLDGMFSCIPKTSSRMYRCLETGDVKGAGEHLDSIIALRDLFVSTGSVLGAFTCAMNLRGCEGSYTQDYAYVPEVTEIVRERLNSMGEL